MSCASCDSGALRSLATFCDCPTEHYFDDGENEVCHNCQYTCLTCTRADICITCDPLMFRQMDPYNVHCECMVKYYDDGLDNELCASCPYTCKTCVNSLACITCNSVSFRH